MTTPPAVTNDLDYTVLTTAAGDTARVHHNGAHLVSWQPAGHAEQLFLSAASDFGRGVAIRGGVPIVFPQFSDYGPLGRHGFARNRVWQLIERYPQRAIFRLAADADTRSIWPHDFDCSYAITLEPNAVRMQLSVLNRGDCDLHFTVALHTYVSVADVAETRIEGLQNCCFRDNNDRDPVLQDREAAVTFASELDRVYADVPSALIVRDGVRELAITTQSFPDAVIWNPGSLKSAAMRDMQPDGYRRFVCVEAAAIEQPISLAAGESWHGMQRLAVAAHS